jgi:hypothetical protein
VSVPDLKGLPVSNGRVLLADQGGPVPLVLAVRESEVQRGRLKVMLVGQTSQGAAVRVGSWFRMEQN